MSVYYDCVKLEKMDTGRRVVLGWFRDEVTALSAAVEHVLFHSAILASLRKLPELVIQSEYKEEWGKRPILNFTRATRAKADEHGRRIVRTPGTFGKAWI